MSRAETALATYTCVLDKAGKRLYYLQGRRVARKNIPFNILRDLVCNARGQVAYPDANVSRLLGLPRDLQLEILLRLPIYDVIQLAYTIPELAWIKGCDRYSYALWIEIGRKLGIDPVLLDRIKEAYPTLVLDLAHKKEDFSIDRILQGNAGDYSGLYSGNIGSINKYAGYLHTQLLAYALGRWDIGDALHGVLARIGESKILQYT